MLDITIKGPAGSGKTQLAAKIWALLEGKRSLVQVHSFADGRGDVERTRTWNAVSADVIIFDGCFNAAYDLTNAERLMVMYRETHNPNAVAIYVCQ